MTKKEHLKVWLTAFKEAFSLNSVLAAAGTAYFAFFSFFPLILVIVAVASYWFDPLWVESELINQLEFIVPNIAKILGENIDRVVRARTTATATAFVLLAWASSALFSIITRILDSIFLNGKEAVRSRIRYRGLALLLVGGLSLVVISLLFVEFWVRPFLNLPEYPRVLYTGGGFLFSVLVNIALFALLYRFLPHTGPNWSEVWIGATSAGILWAVAKRLFVGYTVKFLSTSNLVYGSVSTIMAFLIWVYFSGLIFFFGAYLGVGYSNERSSSEISEEG